MKQISLRNRIIGECQPVFIIAEAGINHNGDINIAHRLIDAAVRAGSDAVKFQTFVTEENISPQTPLARHHLCNVGEQLSHFELIKKLELPFESFKELKSHCEEKGVVFLSTPYDMLSAKYLIELGCDIIKIASSEMTNYPLLDVVGKSNIPVLLSTGMSRWHEIVDSVNFLEKYHSCVCILKCTSNYPASIESINLRGVLKLKEAFHNYLIGFSDHSEGNYASLTALGFGISLIERHFTLNKNSWGPDHKASMTPDEFKDFVKAIRKSEKALGEKDWEVQEEELQLRETMQKGVYARRDIMQGEQISLEDVVFLRPLGAITPKGFFQKYINKTVTFNITKGEEITLNHFASNK